MKIWLRVKGLQLCSWTTVWRYLREALIREGHEVPGDPFSFPGWKDGETIEMWWGDPSAWEWSSRNPHLRIGIALSEARGIVGSHIAINNLKQCDLLICPSEHAAAAYREAPLDLPIVVVFFGADPQEFPYTERQWDGELRFLHLANIQYRKGSWMVPEAFLKAFRNANDVRLTMANFMKDSRMFAALQAEYGGHPMIDFREGSKPSAYSWYESHHIMVSPHLAEGFGLCIPEAMSTGMPCIISRCSAPLEFFNSAYGWWIEMSELYTPVAWCLKDVGDFWRLPDANSMADKMLTAYEDRNSCFRKGAEASKYIRNNLTWTHTARGIAEAIERIGR